MVRAAIGIRRLTGVCFEGSQLPVWDALSAADADLVMKALRVHADEELRYGITWAGGSYFPAYINKLLLTRGSWAVLGMRV